jgi:hypothetical protein
MTKNLGTDYDRPRDARKSSRWVSWALDLLFPLVVAAAALAIGRFGWPF